jgi:hypothetical protein
LDLELNARDGFVLPTVLIAKREIIMKKFFIIAAISSIVLGTTAFQILAQQNSFTNTDLVGEWRSQKCETLVLNNQPAFLQRNFVFTSSTWNLKYTVFADPGCSVALVSTRIKGEYTLGAAVSLVNTRNITWGQSAKFITPRVPDILKVLNDTQCGEASLALEKERDISVTGCMAFGVVNVKDYAQEYDLLKLEKGQLFTGLRGNAMNLEVNRPTKIFEFPLVKL